MAGITHKAASSLRLLVMVSMITGMVTTSLAQQIIGASIGYRLFPSVRLADPDTATGNLELQTSIKSIGLAFPLAFQKGKILVLNNLNYRRVDFQWENYPENSTAATLDRVISVNYTFFMLDSLSEKWTLIAALTPGLAADFKADKITGDDFTLQAIFGYVRKYSKNFQLGFGLAYMRDFGRPIPLPFIYFDWKKGDKLSASGIVPVDMGLTYKLHPKIDLGLALKVTGDRHHGDPDTYNVDNPQMEYSEGTISQTMSIHLTQWLHLNVEGGYAFYRNFEFLDGDKSAGSYDLERTGYYGVNLVLGM